MIALDMSAAAGVAPAPRTPLEVVAPVCAGGMLAVGAGMVALLSVQPSPWELVGALTLLSLASVAERLPVPAGVTTVSLASVFIVAAGVLYGSATAALVAALANVSGHLGTGKPSIRIAFNASQVALAGGAAGLAATVAGGLEQVLLSVVAGSLAFFAVNITLITCVIVRADRCSPVPLLASTLRSVMLPAALSTSVVPLFVTAWTDSPVIALSSVVPLAAVGLYLRSVAASRRAYELALTDPLTGLGNRRHFDERLRAELDRVDAGAGELSLVLLDLDDFKSVNDTLGHQAGDELLAVVADRFRGCLRAADTCARIGGDEFAIMLEELAAEESATRTAERILESLDAPIVLSGEEVVVRASIGVAFGTPGGTRPGDLLRDADIALYRAKRSPVTPRFAIFEPEMLAGMRERRRLATELNRALERDELRVFYQPIVSLTDRRTVAVEALVRWQHPQQGLLPPAEFIGLAEETELIVPLTRLVLSESCRQVRGWQLEHPSEPPLSLSVNVSGVCLAHTGFVADVERSLAEAGLLPASLALELTETSLIQDLDGARRLDALKEIGVKLGVADFGTGHSSLTYLRSFPIDMLKIDKSFTELLDVDKRDAHFVETIVRLANALGVSTVAEGVEREEQCLRLLRLGCTFGQGYHFARPLPPETFARRLRAEREGRATDAA